MVSAREDYPNLDALERDPKSGYLLRAACTAALDEIDRLRGDENERHLIEFRDDGWTIQHTLRERQSGALFNCPLSTWHGGDPGVRGRFVLLDACTFGETI